MEEYYARQEIILGKDQIKLHQAKIVIVGVGGLGTVVAQLLARMGVGTIYLIDNDIVSVHNLSRQQLFTVEDIGKSKVEAAKSHLESINPYISIITSSERILSQDQIPKTDLVVDGTDNHQTRRIIDLFCKNNSIPWVHGAAIKKTGSVMVFDEKTKYNDIYPANAKDTHCELVGVLATITSIIGTIQAQLVIDLLTSTASKKFIRVDLDTLSFEKFDTSKDLYTT